jgi:hypothetical protein
MEHAGLIARYTRSTKWLDARMRAMHEAYDGNHAIIVHLDEKEIAAARMAVNDEDELPRA